MLNCCCIKTTPSKTSNKSLIQSGKHLAVFTTRNFIESVVCDYKKGNKMSERQLATIRRIAEIKPIEGKDRIVSYRVDG